jgi:hypothetical protein
MTDRERTTDRLLEVAGRTYADESGIKLGNKPAPLYQLLVLATLLSTRISADIAVAAAVELHRDFGTPQRMLDASWQQRVDALGRARYRRYDESTSTALGEGARLLVDKYGGDLRRLRDQAGGDVRTLRELIQEFPRVGPVGSDIFCREAQAVWPELRPYFDRKALDGAKRAGLPPTADQLAELVPTTRLANLAAALVRVTLDKDVRRTVGIS